MQLPETIFGVPLTTAEEPVSSRLSRIFTKKFRFLRASLTGFGLLVKSCPNQASHINGRCRPRSRPRPRPRPRSTSKFNPRLTRGMTVRFIPGGYRKAWFDFIQKLIDR